MQSRIKEILELPIRRRNHDVRLGNKPNSKNTKSALVQMEAHQRYQDMMGFLTQHGFSVVEVASQPQVRNERFVKGNRVELRKEVEVVPGMSFFELQRQVEMVELLLTRLTAQAIPVLTADWYSPGEGKGYSRTNHNSDVLRTYQLAVVRYFNTLQRTLRLRYQTENQTVLKQQNEKTVRAAHRYNRALEAGGLSTHQKSLHPTKLPPRQAWVREHFPDIFALEEEYLNINTNPQS